MFDAGAIADSLPANKKRKHDMTDSRKQGLVARAECSNGVNGRGRGRSSRAAQAVRCATGRGRCARPRKHQPVLTREEVPGGVRAVGQSLYKRVVRLDGKALAAAARQCEAEWQANAPVPLCGDDEAPQVFEASGTFEARAVAETQDAADAADLVPHPSDTGDTVTALGSVADAADERIADCTDNLGILFAALERSPSDATSLGHEIARAIPPGSMEFAAAGLASLLLHCAQPHWDFERNPSRKPAWPCLDGWCCNRVCFVAILAAAQAAENYGAAGLLTALRCRLIQDLIGHSSATLSPTESAAAAAAAMLVARAQGDRVAARSLVLDILLAGPMAGSISVLLVAAPAASAWSEAITESQPVASSYIDESEQCLLPLAIHAVLRDLCLAAAMQRIETVSLESGCALKSAAQLLVRCGVEFWGWLWDTKTDEQIQKQPQVESVISSLLEYCRAAGAGRACSTEQQESAACVIRLLTVYLGIPWALHNLIPNLRRNSADHGASLPFQQLELLGAVGQGLLDAKAAMLCLPCDEEPKQASAACSEIANECVLSICSTLVEAVQEEEGAARCMPWAVAECAVILAAAVTQGCHNPEGTEGMLQHNFSSPDGVQIGHIGISAALLSRMEACMANVPPMTRVPRSLRRACDRAGMKVFFM